MSGALAAMRRPRVLISAARHGLSGYSRGRDLARVLPAASALSARRCFASLLAAEADQDDLRRAGSATYSAARHIGLLTALLAEARLNTPADQTNPTDRVPQVRHVPIT